MCAGNPVHKMVLTKILIHEDRKPDPFLMLGIYLWIPSQVIENQSSKECRVDKSSVEFILVRIINQCHEALLLSNIPILLFIIFGLRLVVLVIPIIQKRTSLEPLYVNSDKNHFV